MDGLSDKTKTEEYRKFIKLNEHFKYPADVMAKIKAHNPAYTKVTTSAKWESVFNRSIKQKDKGFKVKVANNQSVWLYDISDTVGKSLPVIYQNVLGKADKFQAIFDCLTKLSVQPVIFQDGLSERQIIFTLLREIIKHNQTSSIVVEATSYIVCRHLNINTEDFSFGYLLELLDFDVSLTGIKDIVVQDAIAKEAEVLIGYLNANLLFLQTSSPEENSENSTKQADNNTAEKKTYIKEIRTENVAGIDFRIAKVIRNFMSILPDKGIDMALVKDYGYFDENMIPIRSAVAMQLFSKGREIYKLYRNGTEERVDSLEEINQHSGYFGIAHEDWSAVLAQMVHKGLSGEAVKLNRWAKTSESNAGNADSQDQANKSEFNKNGSFVVATDDISHEEIENEVWLDTALRQFFDDTGYKPSDMPYFVSRQDYVITREMKKINEFMLHFCAYNISDALFENKIKSSDTGKVMYKIKKAVSDIRLHFSDRHIYESLDKHWPDIKAPKSAKKAFDDCFEQLRKIRKNQPKKKPTPDESMKRVAAKADANVSTVENTDTSTEQAHQNKINERYAEIFYIIDTYNTNLTEKPKKQSQGKPKMPPQSKQKV